MEFNDSDAPVFKLMDSFGRGVRIKVIDQKRCPMTASFLRCQATRPSSFTIRARSAAHCWRSAKPKGRAKSPWRPSRPSWTIWRASLTPRRAGLCGPLRFCPGTTRQMRWRRLSRVTCGTAALLLQLLLSSRCRLWHVRDAVLAALRLSMLSTSWLQLRAAGFTCRRCCQSGFLVCVCCRLRCRCCMRCRCCNAGCVTEGA